MKLIKNKKAFTLVETLGVIIILAIVLGIVSVSFIYVNNSMKKSYYKGVEASLFTAGGEYFTYNKGEQAKMFGDISKVSVKNLVEGKYISNVVGRGSNTCNLESSYVGAYKDSYDKTNYYVCLICDDYESDTCNPEVGYNLQIRANVKDTSQIYKENTWAPDYITLTFDTLNDIQKVYVKKDGALVTDCELIEKNGYKTCKVTINQTGSYKVYGEAENGNKTEEETFEIKVDSTPPSFEVYDQYNILITNNEINYKKEDATLTVSGTVSDIIDNESGIKRIRYSFEKEGNSETYKELTSSTLSFDFNKEVDLGKYVLIIEVIDNVGNVNKREITYNIYSELGKPDSSYCKSNLVYSGVSQLLTNSPGVGFYFENNYGTDAQVYDVIVRLNENYSWSDGTRNDVIINCEIAKSPESEIGTCKDLTYNGNSQYLMNLDGNNVKYVNNSAEGLNAGTYIVQAQPADSNYAFSDGTTSKTINCTIEKANGYLNLSATTGKITYGTASKNFTVTSSHGGALSVTDNNTTATSILNGNTITLSNLGTITGGTTITATVKSAATTNYKEATAAYSLTINAVNATCPTLTAYSGNYDGNSHSIGVSGGSGGTIQYSIDNSTWTTTKPTRIESGTTTVYVRVVGDTNHNTVTCGSETISISKVDAICPTLTAYSGNYDGYSHSIGVSGGSGGTIQYSTNNSTWTTTKPTRTTAGETTVYVKVIGDTNHNTVSCGSKKITINGTKMCANFYINGAAKIGNSTTDLELCCQPTSGSSSCQVTTPTITPATNFEVLGWSDSSQATYITNEVNEEITLTGSKNYYAITRSNVNMIKSYSIEFNLNGADSYSIQGIKYQETATFVCNTQHAYNGGSIPTTCTFTLPSITRSGGIVYGWDLDENNQGTPTYSQNQTITVSSDMVLNAITSKNISISFDGNGGVSTIPTQTAEVFNAEDGAWITIPAYDNANLCRSKTSNYQGYQNIGLISDTTHTTADYCQGKTYFFDKSETLFGLWKRTYGTGTINTNSKCLYIRESTSTSSDDKACVDKGEKIYLTGKPNSNWYAVKFGSVTGYSWASYISFPSSGYAKNSCEYTGYTCDGKDYELNVSPSKIVLNLYKNETSHQLTIDSQCGSIKTATSSNSKVSVTTSGLVTVPSNAVAYGETLTSTLTFTSAGSCTDTVSVTVKNINETPPTVKISISGTTYSGGYKSGAVATVTCESEEGIKSFTAKDNTGDTGSLSTNTSTKKVRKITLSSASSSRKITGSCTSTNGLSDSASKTVKIYVNSTSSVCGISGYTYSGSCSCIQAGVTMTTPGCDSYVYNAGGCSSYCKKLTSYYSGSGSCTRSSSYKTCWHT